MDFERIEKQVFEVASFLDGLIPEIPKVDFINDYNILKTEIVKKENYNIENFKQLFQFVEACSMFSLAIETRKNEIKVDLYSYEQLEPLFSQLTFFRDDDFKINKFINSHFPEIIEDSELPSTLRYLKEVIYTDEETAQEKYQPYKKIKKIQWKGTPAQLAFIINLLIEKGYIDNLSHSGEGNAKLILELFEIEGHNTTIESLGKCFQLLKKDELPINADDAAKFQKIPNRKDLKR